MNDNKLNRSTAQRKADAKYEKNRGTRPRLSGYLSDDEDELVNEAAAVYGTRKAGIIEALKFWKKHHNK